MDTRRHDSGELDLLTKRRDLLERLCDGPVPKSTLLGDLDLSRSTLDRAVRELESLDLVERCESGVQATVAGRLAVDTLETCQSTLVDIHAAEAVVEPLPLDAPLQRETVVGSDAMLATGPDPYEALEPVHDAVAAAEGYRALLPALEDPRQIDLLYEHVVTDRLPAEIIVTPGLFDTLREQFSERMAAMADCDGFELLLGEELPPFALGLADGADGVTVTVVVFAEGGAVHGTLINRTAVGVEWGQDLFEEIEADAIERTDELRDDGDGSPASDADQTPGTRSLPLGLGTEGFVRLDQPYFRDEPVAGPTTAWRAGLSLPEIHVGYAVDRAPGTDDTTSDAGRPAMHEALVAELVGGDDCVLLGPPGSGKSTVCKQVACEWYDADRGPVLYREQGRGRPFASVEALVGTADSGDGHALVVVEDAVRPEADAVFDAIEQLSDRDDVSFLLDAREREWRDPTADPPSAAGLSVMHMPTLDDSDVERLVTHFERTVSRSVDIPVDRLRREVREETAADDETTSSELLLLLHRLATYADPLADGPTSLEEAVAALYDGLVPVDRNSGESAGELPTDLPGDSASGGLALDVCVLATALTTAGLGVERGLLYAVADDDEFDAVDEAVDRLEGRVLFPRNDDTYRTVHEAWSAAFLAHLLDAEEEGAASDRFCRCVSRLLALTDDPDRREAIASHLDDRSALAAVRDDPERWADETVEAVYVMGRERPKLAPLFGDGSGHDISLPDACSESVAAERSVWLGRMLLAAGRYDRAERTFEQLPDDEPGVAVERLLGLARVAIHRGEYEDGSEYARACLSLADDEDEDRPHDSARASLKLGHTLQELDEYEAASDQLRTALDCFEAVGDRRRLAKALTDFGRLADNQGETDQARAYHERSLDITREIGDRKGQARSLNELGRVAMEAGEYREALTYYERGLDINRDLGDRQGEANALNNIGMVCNMLGRYDQALEYGERSLAIKRKLGDHRGEANSCSTLGIVAASNGDHERAREYFERSARIKGELGDRLGEAMALGNLGNVACRQCDYEAAREYTEQELETIRDLGASNHSAESSINLGEVASRRGRYDRARECLEQARDVAQEVDDQHRYAQSLDRLAAVARRRGDHGRARALLDEALDLAEDVGNPGLLSKVRYRQGALARDAGDYDRARAKLEQAADAVDDGGDRLDVARVRLGRARLALDTGDPEAARDRARAARDSYAELSCPHFEARCRRLLGRVAAESGDHDAARDHFEAALDTFEAVGAPQDALGTLKQLVDVCRDAGDGQALQRCQDRLAERLADAPDATVDAHGDWIDQQFDVGRRVEQD